MSFIEEYNNVYLIDTMMFDFEYYSSTYLVEGKELDIVDAGLPNRLSQLLYR